MALPSTAGGLAAAIDHMPDRRHEGGSECVLDHGRGDEGIPTSQAIELLDKDVS